MPFVALVLLWLDIKMPFSGKKSILIQLCRFPVFPAFYKAKFTRIRDWFPRSDLRAAAHRGMGNTAVSNICLRRNANPI